jgi:hypothetical protein
MANMSVGGGQPSRKTSSKDANTFRSPEKFKEFLLYNGSQGKLSSSIDGLSSKGKHYFKHLNAAFTPSKSSDFLKDFTEKVRVKAGSMPDPHSLLNNLARLLLNDLNPNLMCEPEEMNEIVDFLKANLNNPESFNSVFPKNDSEFSHKTTGDFMISSPSTIALAKIKDMKAKPLQQQTGEPESPRDSRVDIYLRERALGPGTSLDTLHPKSVSLDDFQAPVLQNIVSLDDFQAPVLQNIVSLDDFQAPVLQNIVSLDDFQAPVLQNIVSLDDFPAAPLQKSVSLDDFQADALAETAAQNSSQPLPKTVSEMRELVKNNPSKKEGYLNAVRETLERTHHDAEATTGNQSFADSKINSLKAALNGDDALDANLNIILNTSSKLMKKDLEIKRVKDDGDCLYAALGENADRDASTIRRDLAKHLRSSNITTKEKETLELAMALTELSPEEICNEIEKSGTWNTALGDVIPKMAAQYIANLTGRSVEAMYDSDLASFVCTPEKSVNPSLPPIVIVNEGSHFNATTAQPTGISL